MCASDRFDVNGQFLQGVYTLPAVKASWGLLFGVCYLYRVILCCVESGSNLFCLVWNYFRHPLFSADQSLI